MDDFNQQLADKLAANNGQATYEQVVEIVPAHRRHKTMYFLLNARDAGVCTMRLAKQDGKHVITVFAPNVTPQSAPRIPNRPTQSGGSQ